MKFFNASASVTARSRKKCSRGILKILVQHIFCTTFGAGAKRKDLLELTAAILPTKTLTKRGSERDPNEI